MNEPTTKEEAFSLISEIANKFDIEYRILKTPNYKENKVQYIMTAPKLIEQMKNYLPDFTWNSNYINGDWAGYFSIGNQANYINFCQVINNLYYYGKLRFDKSRSTSFTDGIAQAPGHAIRVFPSFYPIFIYE